MLELPKPAPLTLAQRFFPFGIGRPLVWPLMLLLGRLRVRNAHRVPQTGGVLILSNHRSDIDPIIVQLGCRRNIRFMGKSELFSMPVLAAMIRMAGAFPVRRGEPDRAAIRHAVELLKIGEPVCVFPEGQLTETGELQPIKAGVALIVRAAQVPVICVGLRNTDKIMPYGKVILRPTRYQVEVSWGEPRSFPKDAPAVELLGWVEAQLRELTTV